MQLLQNLKLNRYELPYIPLLIIN